MSQRLWFVEEKGCDGVWWPVTTAKATRENAVRSRRAFHGSGARYRVAQYVRVERKR